MALEDILDAARLDRYGGICYVQSSDRHGRPPSRPHYMHSLHILGAFHNSKPSGHQMPNNTGDLSVQGEDLPGSDTCTACRSPPPGSV